MKIRKKKVSHGVSRNDFVHRFFISVSHLISQLKMGVVCELYELDSTSYSFVRGEIDDRAQNGEASDKVFFDAVFISCCSGIHLMRNTTGWCGDDDEQQKYSKKKYDKHNISSRFY